MNNKGESDRLSLAVRIVMKKNRIRHADLAQALKLSVPTMKRTLSRGPLSIDRLMEICDALKISFYELVEIAKERSSDALEWMSDAQEKFLLEHPDATEYLIHLMNGTTPEEIQNKIGLTSIQTKKYLVRLESQGLIQKAGNGAYKVATPVLRGARPEGALALDFARRCSNVVPNIVREGLLNPPSDLLSLRQSHKVKTTTAIGFQLSAESRKDMHEQLKDVLSRFAAIERKEARSLPASQLGPLAVIVSAQEVNLYSEAYRNSLKGEPRMKGS